MKFVFWQNIVSIHQSAFLKALAVNHDVTLVAEQDLDRQRKDEKWSVPDMGRTKIIVAPAENQISELIGDKSIYHVFSGIDAFPMVFRALRLAVKNGCEISVMAEPYDWTGFKGRLRMLKYRGLFVRYGKYINHLFTTGNHGIKCFQKSGFPLRKMQQWGYFTEIMSETPAVSPVVSLEMRSSMLRQKIDLIYVGRFDENKNILPVLLNFNKLRPYVNKFTVVGSGPLDNEIRQAASKFDEIVVAGRLNNVETQVLMRNHDYLILPSLYDGWGAVVNEALTQGTRVLCSEACGASILLDGQMRGATFSQTNAMNVMQSWFSKGPVSAEQREMIKDWVKRHISGECAADYFVKVMSGEHVEAPWINS